MVGRTRDLLSVRGLLAGHAEDPEGRTGVTVVRFDRAVPTVVDVRGGASGTFDTASLALDATFGRRWAVFFAGGSLFGLDAARGVRAWLLENGHGAPAFGGAHRIAPISGAVIFDLPREGTPFPDYLPLGYEAARRAGRSTLAEGRVGAGAGATVGKYLGRRRAMAGGLGSAARSLGAGGHVGALVVVNAAGAVRDPSSGRWVAGARARGGGLVPPDRIPRRGVDAGGTTLTLIATDLALTRVELARVASIVHAGLGRAIVPYLTALDGDCVFAVSTEALARPGARERPGSVADRVGRLAADAAVEAALRAFRRPPRKG